MSYQVLARKWRPSSFAELVGQEHVRRALVNALDNDRLHHAFLFTGTRGVGKTTIARILAKSLNCEAGVSSTPCGKCTACCEINEGRFVDLIEVDAASRTKVEDTRELLDNVQYAPTRARYKVYLIDEVHMLSNHSFNALLKTLEEPPPHVKFLLATTDPQRLPVTILSRCLQFNLKRISPLLINNHMQHILKEENIKYEVDAVMQIANAADGSMRDALSLLDQAIAYCADTLHTTDVCAMLGTIEQHYVYEILLGLANNDIQKILDQIEQIAQLASDFESVLVDLLSILHHLALTQFSPEPVATQLQADEQFKQLLSLLSAEDIQLYYQIGLIGRKDLPFAPNPRSGFEMTVLRMLAFKPNDLSAQNSIDKNQQLLQPKKSSSNTTSDIIKNKTTAPPIQSANEARSVSQSQPVVPNSPSIEYNNDAAAWEQIVENINLKGITHQLVKHCALKEISDTQLTLAIADSHKQLLNNSRIAEIEQAIQRVLKRTITLRIITLSDPGQTPAVMHEQRATDKLKLAHNEIANDKNVKDIIDTFDAHIIPDSIQPID